MHQSFTILILDPQQRIEPSLSGLLREKGYEVATLNGPLPTAALVATRAPDLVLAEVTDGTGLDLIAALQFKQATRHIPIIAVAFQAELEYELLDIFDFLTHPIDRHRLLDDLALISRSRPGQLPVVCDPLGQEDLDRFHGFLVQLSGLHFDHSNSKILERGACRRMRALRMESYEEYFRYLKRYQNSRQELKKLLSLLTVGETFFFRYRAHFEALQQQIIPELIERNREQRRLRIWSAGCSTGEEPYSIAMLLLEHFPELADWQVDILATDINYQSLRRAREGIYRKRALRVTTPEYRERYFIPSGGRFEVAPEPRRMVQFGYLNLQTGRYPAADNGTADIDLLFCRNVMIYFRQETNRRIMDRIARCLRPSGVLFLGHAATLQDLSDCFLPEHYRGGFFYRLPEAPRPAPAVVPHPPVIAPSRPVVRPPESAAPTKPKRKVPVAAMPAGTVEPGADELLEQARQAFDREEFAVAETAFERLLRLRPELVPALIGMGFIRANQERHEEALEFCERALAVDDLAADAYFLRGLIFELRDELAESIEEYRKALLLDLDFIMPHYNLSRIYRRLERPREARRELNNTLRLLEQTADESIIPHSGGVSRAVLLEICREDSGLFEAKESLQ